jgi:hypothetical protein
MRKICGVWWGIERALIRPSGTFSHREGATGEGNLFCGLSASAFSRPKDGRRCRQADEGLPQT